MAHVGQKLRLGGGGVFSLLQGLLDLSLLGQGLPKVAALQGLAFDQLGDLAPDLQVHNNKSRLQGTDLITTATDKIDVVITGPNIAGGRHQHLQRPGQGHADPPEQQ